MAKVALSNSPMAQIPGITKHLRFGQSCLADEAYFAWTSGDLDRMRAALACETNAVDRHMLLSTLVEKLDELRRESPDVAAELVRTATLHLREFPALLPELLRDAQIRRDQAAQKCRERGDSSSAARITMAPLHWGVFSSHHRLFQVLEEAQLWEARADAADIALQLGLIDQGEHERLRAPVPA